jgi:tape measure domain-containing protein
MNENPISVSVEWDESRLRAGLRSAQDQLQKLPMHVRRMAEEARRLQSEIGSVMSSVAGRFAGLRSAVTSAFTSSAASAREFFAGLGNSVSAGLQAVASGAKRVQDKYGKALDELSAQARAVGVSLSLSLTAPLVGLGVAAVQSAANIDSIKRALVAVAGSAEGAEKQLANLKEIAKLPGIGFEEAVQGSVRLQAVGFSAALAERSLKAFANAIALTGGGRAQLASVTVQLGQLASKGKVLAGDLRPIIEAAPAVGTALKKAFGTVVSEEIQQKLEATRKTSKDFVNELLAALETLPRVEGGIKNTFENLKDSSARAIAPIGDAILRVLIPAIDAVTPKLEQWGEAFARLSPTVQTVVVGLGLLAAGVGPALLAFSSLINAFTTALAAAQALGQTALWNAIVSGATAAANAVKSFALAAVASLSVGQIWGLVAVAAVALGGAVYLLARNTKGYQEVSLQTITTLEKQAALHESQLKQFSSLTGLVAQTAEEQERLKDVYKSLNPESQARVDLMAKEKGQAEALRAEVERLLQARREELSFKGANVVAEFVDKLKEQAEIEARLNRLREERVSVSRQLNDPQALRSQNPERVELLFQQYGRLQGAITDAEKAADEMAAALKGLDDKMRAAEAATKQGVPQLARFAELQGVLGGKADDAARAIANFRAQQAALQGVLSGTTQQVDAQTEALKKLAEALPTARTTGRVAELKAALDEFAQSKAADARTPAEAVRRFVESQKDQLPGLNDTVGAAVQEYKRISAGVKAIQDRLNPRTGTGGGGRERSEFEILSRELGKLTAEVESLHRAGSREFELRYKVEGLRQLKNDLTRIHALRHELGQPLALPLPSEGEMTRALIVNLERAKRVQDEVRALTEEQLDAEARLAVARRAITIPVIQAQTRAQTALYEALRQQRNAQEEEKAARSSAGREAAAVQGQTEQISARAQAVGEIARLEGRLSEELISNEEAVYLARLRYLDQRRVAEQENVVAIALLEDRLRELREGRGDAVDDARRDALRRRLEDEKRVHEELIALEDFFAHAGERSADRVRLAYQNMWKSVVEGAEQAKAQLQFFTERTRALDAGDPAEVGRVLLEGRAERAKEAFDLSERIIRTQDAIAHAGENAARRQQLAYLQAYESIVRADLEARESIIRSQVEIADQSVFHVDRAQARFLDHLARQKSLTESVGDAMIKAYEGVASSLDSGIDRLTKKLGFFGSVINDILKSVTRQILTRLFVPLSQGVNGAAAGGNGGTLGALLGGVFAPLLTGGRGGGVFSTPGFAGGSVQIPFGVPPLGLAAPGLQLLGGGSGGLVQMLASGILPGLSGRTVGGGPIFSGGGSVFSGLGLPGLLGGGGFVDTAVGGGAPSFISGVAQNGVLGALTKNGILGGKVSLGQAFGSLTGGLALPLLGASLGASLGGPSTLGKFLGGAGGALAGAIPSLFALGSLLGPIGLVAAPLLLLGGYLLGKAKQRKQDERTADTYWVTYMEDLKRLTADVKSDRISGSEALRAAYESRQRAIDQINTIKTKSVRESRLRNQIPDVDRLFLEPLKQAADAQKRRGDTERLLVPTFSTGGSVMQAFRGRVPGHFDRRDDKLIRVSGNEVVLTPQQWMPITEYLKVARVPGFESGGFAGDALARAAAPALAAQQITLEADIVLGDGTVEGAFIRAVKRSGGRAALIGEVRREIRDSSGTGLSGDIRRAVK